MWTTNYWLNSYFAPEYWANTGATLTAARVFTYIINGFLLALLVH